MIINGLKVAWLALFLSLLNCGVDDLSPGGEILDVTADLGHGSKDINVDEGKGNTDDGLPDGSPVGEDWDPCRPAFYNETLVDLDPPLGDIISSYEATEYREFIKVGLQRRAPFTRWIVDEVQKTQNFDCIEVYASDAADLGAIEMLQRATTVVHECAHGLNMATWDGVTHDYYVRPNEVYRVDIIDGPERRVIKNYLLWEDNYSETYLNLSGDQQFDMVLEEVNGYINDLITGVAFVDVAYEGQQYSLRDGTTTLLLYMAIYLHHLRLNDMPLYQRVVEDKDWRVLILTLWDRGLLALKLAAPYPELGIDDEKIRVELDKFGSEIERVRDLHCP